MTLVAPGDILEAATRHLDAYRPVLEEMFDVDLSGVKMKPVDFLADDFYESLQHADLDNPRTRLERIASQAKTRTGPAIRLVCEQAMEMQRSSNSAGCYLEDMDSIYVGREEPIYDISIARMTVHELCHSIVKRIADPHASGVDPVLWLYIDEGFAEYVSIDRFSDSYGLGLMWAERGAMIEKINEDINTSLDTLKGMGDEERIKDPDPELFEPHAWGYNFMRRAAEKGVDPVEILKHPPTSFLDVLMPDEYIAWMAGRS